MRTLLSLSLICLSLTGCKLNISYVGQGEITASDGISLSTSCGSQADLCSSTALNQQVTLTAQPAEGFQFAGWGGDCNGTESCSVKMSGNRNVHAYFEATTSENYFLLKPDNGVFFATPWPSDLRRDKKGNLAVHQFPFEKDGAWAKQLTALAEKTPGFSTNGAIYFRTSRALPSYKNLATSDILLFEMENPAQQVAVTMTTFHAEEDLKRSHLLALLPEQPLKPETRYGMVITSGFADYDVAGSMVASPLLNKLITGNDNLTESESRLDTQWQTLQQPLAGLGIAANDILAFTVFTTQNPDRYHDLIRNTVAEWDDEFILSRHAGTEEIRDCSASSVRQLSMEVAFPSYLSGTPPFTSGGGKLVAENNRLVEQSLETFDIHILIPCTNPPTSSDIGIVIEAAETASNAYPGAYENNTGTLRVLIDAPYSNPQRRPRLGGLIETILDLADISQYSVFETLSHFNPFNLESNLGLHYQYTIDLLFARHFAARIESLIPDYLPAPVNSTKIGYSGESFGAIAALHAASIDRETDSLNLSELSRLSYLSINHLIENNHYIPDELVNFMSAYAGVTLPGAEADPTFHLLQTALEPLDLINFVNDYRHLPMMVLMDEYDHPFHGGPSSYSFLRALHASVPFNPEFNLTIPSNDWTFDEVIEDLEDELGWYIDPQADMNLPIFGDMPLRLLIPDEAFDDDACFHYEVFYHDVIDSRYQYTPPCLHD